MRKTVKGLITALMLIVVVLCMTVFGASAAKEDSKWITAWGTAPTEIGIDGYQNIAAYIGNVTSRTVITPTANGSKLRIRVSNYYGDSALKLTRVTVAKSLGGSKIDPESVKIVTFNEGQQFISVPAGKEYYSDPVTYDVVAGEDIAISIYIEDFTEVKTMGLSGGDTYLALSGDYTSRESMDLGSVFDAQEIMEYLVKITGSDLDVKLAYSFIKVVPCLASMDVLADENAYSVVVVGDSTVSNEFPEYLSDVINSKGITNVGVAGKGLMGNSLLSDGLGYGSLIFGESLLDRFQRDVLSQPSVKYVVVKIGANDIMHPVCSDIVEMYPDIKQPTWQDIANGYRKFFRMCHDAGVKVIALSITPWKGATRDYFGTGAKYVRTNEEFAADWAIAENVNKWLSTTSEHDGYFDLNEFSANPKDSSAFYPEYTVDGIHPSDIMQKEWARRFPMSIIGVGTTVAGISLNKTSAKVYVGTKGTLIPTIYPSTASNKSVKWSSSKPSVATVNSKGVVECVGAGETVITCTTVDGGYKATCTIKVYAKPTSIKLNKSSVSMYVTKSTKLTATVLPENANNKKVTWSSSNKKVAEVDKNGKVTAVGSGTAVITAKTEVGGLTAKCTVKVLKKVEVASLALSTAQKTIVKGKTYRITSAVYPENATFQGVTWTSSNTKVITVDKNGNVKGVGAGKATITCRSVDNPRVIATCNITVVVKATGVKLSYSKGSVYAGFSGTLKATVLPSDATNKKVTWSSSNKAVATVDQNGKVTGVKPGTAVITCTTKDGSFKAKCTVTVKPVVKVTSVTLNKKSGALYAGTYGQLTATVKPSNASIKKVIWHSSDTSVVKVSSSGKVLAVKPGTAVITCTSYEGGKTATCTVKVVAVKPTSVKLNATSKKLNYGQTYQLKATVGPENATNKKVTWTSSNPKAVSVSSSGLVKALKANASAVITCKTVSGGKTATCTVKVNPISATGVKLSHTKARLPIGSRGKLTATVLPSNASNKSVVWTSMNTSVATVDQNGIVTAKKAGTTTIYCKTKDGGHSAACLLTVYDDTPPADPSRVGGVKLNKSNINGTLGTIVYLTATVVPETATNKEVKWSSSDKSVAIVSQSGQVFLVGKGECKISVATVDGNYGASCKVVVS